MSVPRILTFCLLPSVLVAVSQPVVSRSKSSQPDVYLITIDTLRADHVGCYGYAKIQTPAIDALAGDGIRFTQAFTPSPITNTSHTTILTGLLPSTHGVTDFAVPLAPSHPTWAELLKPAGYRTAAFIGAVILDSKTLAPGLGRGFDFYDNFPEHPQTSARWGRVERRGMEVVRHAESWMTVHPSSPAFVWVHLYDPHDPYEPPPPFSATYQSRPYDGEIAYADSALGHFVAYLKQSGRYNGALIVLVGDHGEGLGEHREETHGIFLYDSTTHVPLIVKLPGRSHGATVVESQVRTTDILPTILDLLQVTPPAHFDGETLKSYLAGAEKMDRTAIGETDYPLRFGWAALRSVRAEGFKFIEAPQPELYDLRADPGELKNNYQPEDANVQKSIARLAQLGQKPPSQLPDPKDKIEEQNLLHAAMMASDDNRLEDARRALEKVLQLDRRSPTALRQLGELELKAGDYAPAADHLKQAREVRPDDATAALYEGQARGKSGDLAGARDALEASLKLTPGQLPARILLGQVYFRLKDLKNAADQFEAAQLIDADSVEAQVGSARVQTAEGHATAALQQLEPLSKSHPASPEILEALAETYRAAGKQEAAQQAEQKARSLRQTKAGKE